MSTIMIIDDDGIAECPKCHQRVVAKDANARITCHCDDAEKYEQLTLPGL